jgi:hypothetical protein
MFIWETFLFSNKSCKKKLQFHIQYVVSISLIVFKQRDFIFLTFIFSNQPWAPERKCGKQRAQKQDYVVFYSFSLVLCYNKTSKLIPYNLYRFYFLYIVMCMPIARQRLGKYVTERTNVRKNRTSIARQRISKHASLTMQAVFSVGSLQIGYKEVFGRTEWVGE